MRSAERNALIIQEIQKGVSIQALGKRFKLTRQRVSQIYHKLTGQRIDRKKQVWAEDRIARLGTAPDSELARLWGIPVSTIWVKRRDLGILAFVAERERKPTKNRVGEKHHWLEIQSYQYMGVRGYRYICLCHRCGKTTRPLEYSNIKKMKSCGCYAKECRDKVSKFGVKWRGMQ